MSRWLRAAEAERRWLTHEMQMALEAARPAIDDQPRGGEPAKVLARRRRRDARSPRQLARRQPLAAQQRGEDRGARGLADHPGGGGDVGIVGTHGPALLHGDPSAVIEVWARYLRRTSKNTRQ